MKIFGTLVLGLSVLLQLEGISAHWHGGGRHGGSSGGSSGRKPAADCRPENRTMAQIYKAALAEMKNGEKLIIYAGGDAPSQNDYAKDTFEAQFPGIKTEMIVDLSKYHNARVDSQLAENSVIPDVVQLQSLHDFPRWKKEGVLLNYKMIDWNKIHDSFKDPDGAFSGVTIYSFSNNVNKNLLPNQADWPREARDYLKPIFKNRLVMTYPNDDDAVLFLMKKFTDKYGMDYLKQLHAQNVTWVRGTQTAIDKVAADQFVATYTANGNLDPAPEEKLRYYYPTNDAFVIWPQTAAIMKAAKHPEAAKLYMSWMISLGQQNSTYTYSVRSDVPPPPGQKPIFQNRNGDPLAFGKFMEDRAAIERYKGQVSLVIGEPQGPDPNGDLGFRPTKAIHRTT